MKRISAEADLRYTDERLHPVDLRDEHAVVSRIGLLSMQVRVRTRNLLESRRLQLGEITLVMGQQCPMTPFFIVGVFGLFHANRLHSHSP